MKINFTHSEVYDEMLTVMHKREFDENEYIQTIKYKDELSKFWKKDESKIVKEIEKVSNLKFKSDQNCFVVSHMKYTAISNPLTIRRDGDFSMVRATLIHELIHILFSENSDKLFKLINKTYKDESRDFKIHVPVLLITRKVLENLYGDQEYEKVLHRDSRLENLREVWPTANSIYYKFKLDIIKFLKNEKLN